MHTWWTFVETFGMLDQKTIRYALNSSHFISLLPVVKFKSGHHRYIQNVFCCSWENVVSTEKFNMSKKPQLVTLGAVYSSAN